MREFKLGIMDCDYVIAKLDGNYVRAWLYRAAAYKRLNDEANYEDSVSQARRLNRSQNFNILMLLLTSTHLKKVHNHT